MLDLHPYTLLLTVLTVITTQQIITAVGKSHIEKFIWKILCQYNLAPSSSKIKESAKKSQELRDLTKQRNAISAQDNYAKWTKLNRSIDKLDAEIKLLNESLTTDQAHVGKYLGYVITVFTTLPIWFFRVWFRKSSIFYLPAGVLPYPVEWFLALPFMPTGTVGLTIWMFALNSVVGSIISFIKFEFFTPVVEKPIQDSKNVEKKD